MEEKDPEILAREWIKKLQDIPEEFIILNTEPAWEWALGYMSEAYGFEVCVKSIFGPKNITVYTDGRYIAFF